jgi:hypothetical protein
MSDIGFIDNTNALNEVESDTTIIRLVKSIPITTQAKKIVSPFSIDLTSFTYSIYDINDWYIQVDFSCSHDGTPYSAKAQFDNPASTFIRFANNKVNWLAYSSYYKVDSETIREFVILPELQRVVSIDFSYYENWLDITDALYVNKFSDIKTISDITISNSL